MYMYILSVLMLLLLLHSVHDIAGFCCTSKRKIGNYSLESEKLEKIEDSEFKGVKLWIFKQKTASFLNFIHLSLRIFELQNSFLFRYLYTYTEI